jgi:hypothetical protein
MAQASGTTASCLHEVGPTTRESCLPSRRKREREREREGEREGERVRVSERERERERESLSGLTA